MKHMFKKFIAVSCGICAGMLSGGAVQAAQVSSPGAPYIPSGNDGTSGSGSGFTGGRFTSIQQLGTTILQFMERIVVPFIMTLALLAFIWGVLHYIRHGGEDAEREQGRQFMLWGIIGLAVMVSVWGLVRMLTNTIGVPLGIPSLNPIK